MLKIHDSLFLGSNFFLHACFQKMGCSISIPPIEEINNTRLPSLLWTSCTNLRYSLYDSPLPLLVAEISSVGGVWFFFGTTQ